MKDDTLGIIILLAIIAVVIFGGAKGVKNTGTFVSPNTTPQSETKKQADIEKEIKDAQKQVEILKKEIQLQEDMKTQSKYKGLVKIQQVSRSSDPSREYITLYANNRATTTIPITGWALKSLRSGASVIIPKATYLIFAGSLNTEDPIVLNGGDTVYLVTGISPNGYSFKVNKCSGYMSQFQTFIPYLSSSCPAPRNEDLSSIPDTVNNEKCFDYINTFPMCRIQTGTLPVGLSSECQNFIYNKINYGSCINTHRYDKDFYQKYWRVYLKRSDRLWKDRRENIILYDNEGKIVDSFIY